MTTIQTISPSSLKELYDFNSSLKVLDVRTPAEFQSIRVSFARSAPLEALNPRQAVAQNGIEGDEPIYLICQTGARARKACEKFQNDGIRNVYVVEGGIQSWKAAGYPVVEGLNTISLERQVRITAGSLVLFGTVLGLTFHPVFLGLSAFVGAGLVFAGITDTCGMALLLARMPWNQRANKTRSCQ